MVKQGYKQTEIGVIPEDWEVGNLKDITALFKSGYGITSRDISETDGKYPVYGGNGLRGFTNTFTHNDKLLLIGRQGALCGNLNYVENAAFISEHAIAVKSNSSNNTKYFYYAFDRLNLNSLSESSAQPGLSVEKLLKLQIPLPPLPEQEAIAEALSDADAWIASLEQLIAKKRLIKQGAMQELLTPKEDWEVKKLGEVIETTQLGGNYQNSEEQNDYPLMKMGNLQRGFISLKKIEYVKGQIPSEKDLLKTNDLLFNTRNTLDLVGKVSIWRNELPIAYFNSNIMRICFNKKFIASNVFVNAVFNTKEFLGKLKDIATGTTSVAAIYTRDLFELEFSFPSLSEQERIATILSEMDAELEALEQQMGKAQQIKQGMMQELLTGRIRLV